MSRKIFDTDFLKKLDNIVINVRMAMSEGQGGNRKSRSKGSSVEFSDFREYSTGDDFRRIDWNAYGRFDKLFVKLFMEEREALVNIFIDCSRSMNSGEPAKSAYAARLAAVLAFLALNNLDRVCLNSIYQNNIKQSSTVTGRAMFDRCMSYLESLDFAGETNINSSIKKKEFRGRGIAIIISDFFTEGGIEEAVKYLLYKNQDVVLIHLLSKDELKPSFEGQVRLLDSETKTAIDVAVTPTLLKQYEKTLTSFINNIKEFSTRVGASYIQVSTADLLEKVVFEDLTKIGIIK